MNESTAKALAAGAGWLREQPEWVRDALLGVSRLRTFELGEFAFHAGDEPGGFYGVVDGGFGVLVSSGAHDLLLCHILRRGNWFGYGPALTGARRQLSFKVVERSRALYVPLREVNLIGARSPEFFRAMAALTEANLIMTAVQVVGDLMIGSGERRIAAVLARNARPLPSETAQPPWPIRLSQAEIGQMSNSSRDRVNRALAKFARTGWITTSFRSIIVNDLAALEAFARAE